MNDEREREGERERERERESQKTVLSRLDDDDGDKDTLFISLHRDLYVFIHPANILFTPHTGVYMHHFVKSCFIL